MAKDTDAVNPEPQNEEQPKPHFTEQPAGQPYDQAGDPPVTLESFRSMVREEMQSVKDTRLGQLGTKVEDLESALAQYRTLVKSGMPEDQAEAKMLGDDRILKLETALETLQSGEFVAEPLPGGSEKPWGERQQAILSGANIKENDPRVTEFMKKDKSPNVDIYMEALNEKTLEWNRADLNKPKPSAISVAQTIPAVPAGDGVMTLDSYTEAMFNARGKPQQLAAIKAQAREDGLNVDNIVFNT